MPHAIQIRQTGGPEVLNWTSIEVGEPGSGQVRLRQVAAGPNYIDVRFIQKRIVASLGFRSVEGAWRTIEGYDAMHAIRKGQIRWLAKG